MLVKYPSRGRPQIFQRTLALYLQDPTVRVLVTCDEDDRTMQPLRDWLDTLERVKVRWGNSRTKIEAINDGLADEEWELCMVGSDDMIPQLPKYAQRIEQLFYENFPLGDGVLHLNDGRTGRTLNTLPILDRFYFELNGNVVYRPEYRSVYADDEFQAVSEREGRAVYVDETIIRHDWIGSTHPNDPLHLHNEGFHEEDAALFKARRAKGFPKESLAFAESV